MSTPSYGARRANASERPRLLATLPLLLAAACAYFLSPLAGPASVAAGDGDDNKTAAAEPLKPADAAGVYNKLPLTFEANAGQADERVLFTARGVGYTLFLTRGEAVLTLREPARAGRAAKPAAPGVVEPGGDEAPAAYRVLRMKLVGAAAEPEVVGLEEQPGKFNYFVGSDPARWRANVPAYAKVRYREVYKGVDLVYYGAQRELEYDFHLAPGADPRAIRLTFEGAESASVDKEGALVLGVPGGEVRMRRPVVYQPAADGARRELDARFVVEGKSSVSFRVGDYDRGRPLVIDPILSYSTYLGSGGNEYGYAVAVDSAGGAYVTGQADSATFPKAGALFTSDTFTSNVFVSKFDPAGGALVYSTLIGGGDRDTGLGVAVDAQGAAYATGRTASSDFPTVNAFKTKSSFYASGDGAATWSNNATGLPAEAQTLAVAPSDPATMYAGAFGVYKSTDGGATWSKLTGNALQSSSVAMLAVSPSSPQTVYASNSLGVLYKSADGGANWAEVNLGAASTPVARCLEFDPTNPSNVFLGTANGFYKSADGGATWTLSKSGLTNVSVMSLAVDPQTPTTVYAGTFGGGVYKSTNAGGDWAPVNTGVGGSFAGYVTALAVDPVTPSTVYLANGYAGTGGAIHKSTNGGASWSPVNNGVSSQHAVTSLVVNRATPSAVYAGTHNGVLRTTNGGALWSPANTRLWSPKVNRLVADPFNPSRLYAATGPSQRTEDDAFVFKLSPAGDALAYSTYLGGLGAETGAAVDVDGAGAAYVVGQTASDNFPVAGALQPALKGSVDGFVTKLSAAGDALVYSTYLGGSGGEDARGVAVDSAGSAYVTGSTGSNDFATTVGAFQRSKSGADPSNGDAFVTKLNPAGDALVYSTYLGGSGAESAHDIEVDSAGAAHVAGQAGSSTFPTANALRAYGGGSSDAFVTKLSAAGSALLFSTFLGGDEDDGARGVALDGAGNVYVAGTTRSRNFPVTAGALKARSGLFVSGDGGRRWGNENGSVGAQRTLSFAFDPASPLTAYAGSSLGLFKTTNGGRTWLPSTSGITGSDVVAVAVDPQTPTTLYAATTFVRTGQGVGLFKSTNGGASWSPSHTGLAVYAISDIAIDPSTPSTVYVGAYDGVYKSVNSGASWAKTSNNIADATSVAIDPTAPQTVYAAGYSGSSEGGLFKTTDGGANWTRLSGNGGGLPGGAVAHVELDPLAPSTVYASMNGGLYKTTDGGATWALKRAFTVAAPLAVDPRLPSTLYLGADKANGHVLKSVDGGDRWSPTGGVPYPVLALAASPHDPAAVFAGTNTFGVDSDDVFVARLNASGSALAYSTYLGGTGDDSGLFTQDFCTGVAADAGGAAYVTGITRSPDFPVTADAFQPFKRGGDEVFLAKLLPSLRIGGRVADGGGAPRGGVLVTLSGSRQASQLTAPDGSYDFSGLAAGGGYAVSVSAVGLTFAPASRAFADLAADQTADFTASASAAPFHVISGVVSEAGGVGPVPGASVALTGSQTAHATTDGVGRYSFNVPAGGDYTVAVAAGAGFAFTPPSRSVSGLAGDVTLDFAAARQDFVVTNTKDGGAGSLRQAIADANQTPGRDRVAFNIPGDGVRTINLGSELPAVTDPLVIDGSTQPGFAGRPVVELTGPGFGLSHLLRITAGASVVRSLVINRAGSTAVRLEGAGGNTVEGCYIGTDAAGAAARPNIVGVVIAPGSDNNTIGGEAPGAGNVISGNQTDGLEISSSHNRVQGNFIGTDATGMSALPNGSHGVELFGPGVDNLVGPRNVISGNSTGVAVGSADSFVQGNYIGTDATGLRKLPNRGNGVVSTAAGVIIGGTTAATGNVISGNEGSGVYANAAGNRVQGNLIGTDATGAAALGNDSGGVTARLVGGAEPGARNVISANGGSGNVWVSTGHVLGNYIGTDITGSYALDNPYAGVTVAGPGVVVGGAEPGARNVISGNRFGLLFVNSDGVSVGSSVRGNYIGTDAAGAAPVPNTGPAVYFAMSASGNFVGGPAPGDGNLIAFNWNGIVSEPSALRNMVRGNRIFSNGYLGLDLGDDGPDANDTGDADSGANNRQNHPVITSVAPAAGGGTNVRGSLNAAPNTQFLIDVYANRACDPTGHGEGAAPFGVASVVTDAAGDAAFDVDFPAALPAGRALTATATDPAGNTSELSRCDASSAAGSVELDSVQLNVLEDVGALSVRVLRAGGSRGALTVNYTTVAGTAAAGSDYTHVSGALTFADGETEKTFALPVADDGVAEPEETLAVVLSAADAETLGGRPRAAVHIFEKTTPVTLAGADVTVTEGDSGRKTALVTVGLSAATGRTVSFDYAQEPGSPVATAGADYLPLSGSHTFAPGTSVVEFHVPIVGDTIDEANESFVFSMTNVVNVDAVHSPFVVILDDDAAPTLSVTDVTAAEGAGSKAAFHVRLSQHSGRTVTFNYSTADGTAAAGSDYTAAAGSLVFLPGQTIKTIEVDVAADAAAEPDETFFLNITSANAARATVADGQGQATVKDASASASLVQFAAAAFAAGEADGQALVTVTRAGDTTQAASVDYRTIAQTASDRSDFTASVGTLRFEPGQTQQSFAVLITDDRFNEAAESLDLVLSSAAGAALGGPSVAVLTINSDDAADGPSPVRVSSFDTQFFVRQHYHDFLNRVADADGLRFWTDEIESCGADAACREAKRVNVSAAFFLSIEFQETGFLAYRTYKAAYGDAASPGVPGTVPVIRLGEFLVDAQRLGRGVQVGVGDWRRQLEENKNAYALEFVGRQRFLEAYPASLTAEQFIAKLQQSTGGALSADEQAQLVASLGATPADPHKRAAALRAAADDEDLRRAELNRAFVLMQYFGYLRRNPSDLPDGDFRGWRFWLTKLEEFNGNFVEAEMVRAFLDSDEYRDRFGR